jgi:hypothetical protein
MRSPAGWAEPGQRPEFDEYTVLVGGAVRVETDSGVLEVAAGQAVLVRSGEWVRYSTPEGAEYISVCLPAFSLALFWELGAVRCHNLSGHSVIRACSAIPRHHPSARWRASSVAGWSAPES